MLRRCIMIFPVFKNMTIIDDIRDKYDPLAKHVRPHITLVFPFESDINDFTLKQHMCNTLRGVKPFRLSLNGITGVKSFGNYLFLNIKTGRDEIIEIHQKLYSGILEEFYPKWLNGGRFEPHMTVGKIDNENEFIEAVNKTKNVTELFEAEVNEINVEIIDENEDSIIEFYISLK